MGDLIYGRDFTIEQIGMKRGQRDRRPNCSICDSRVPRPYVRLELYRIGGGRELIGRLCFGCLEKIGLGYLIPEEYRRPEK